MKKHSIFPVDFFYRKVRIRHVGINFIWFLVCGCVEVLIYVSVYLCAMVP